MVGVLLSAFMFAIFSEALKNVQTKLKIGIKKEVVPCRKQIENDDMVYAHIVARVEGRDAPVVDTYKAGKPMFFMVNNSEFISGFNQGMRGACEGEIRRITIPPELAYRGESVEGLFGPHSSWIVDAEILEVLKNRTF
jgi:FK506-binding protein 2